MGIFLFILHVGSTKAIEAMSFEGLETDCLEG